MLHHTPALPAESDKEVVVIKNGKIVACPVLCQKLKCDISTLTMDIFSYDFPIENKAFINGICKIAFNFALEKGVDIKKLSHGNCNRVKV